MDVLLKCNTFWATALEGSVFFLFWSVPLSWSLYFVHLAEREPSRPKCKLAARAFLSSLLSHKDANCPGSTAQQSSDLSTLARVFERSAWLRWTMWPQRQSTGSWKAAAQQMETIFACLKTDLVGKGR